MPEPTDHRAEAEEMLQLAHVGSHGLEVSQLQALIGIGHALLALSDVPPHGGSDGKCRGLYNDGHNPSPYRCGLRDGHQPPHLYEPPVIPRAPAPLSPSEG